MGSTALSPTHFEGWALCGNSEKLSASELASTGRAMTDHFVDSQAKSPGRKPRGASSRGGTPEAGDADFKGVSTVLTDSFERLFRLGGLVLVALFIGMMLMVLSFIFVASGKLGAPSDGRFDVPQMVILAAFCLGAFVVVSVLLVALCAALFKRHDVRRTLRENSEMADALQAVALRVTEGTLQLQSLLLVNAQSVADVLVAAAPVLSLFGAEDVAGQTNLNEQIIDILESTRVVAEQAKAAIAASDPRPLFGYTEELAKLNQAVVAALKKPRPSLKQLSDEVQVNVARLQRCVAEFCEGVETVNARALHYVGLINGLGSMTVVGPLLKQGKLGQAMQDGERLEKMLTAAGNANQALAGAVKSGRGSEYKLAVDNIMMLRALVSAKADDAPADS